MERQTGGVHEARRSLKQSARGIVDEVEGADVLEAVVEVVVVEADVVGPYVDAEPVEAEAVGSVASPVHDFGS